MRRLWASLRRTSRPHSLTSTASGFPGVGCNCAPPDTNGAVGATQYVQIVNEGYQVFNKSTGASVLGPNSIASVWTGFGGVCETGGKGDPVMLYDHLANRWLISQFAGSGSAVTDECVAISTTSDATGSYYRYGFHLGTNFYDYPHLSVWPDAYYMSMNIFNAAGTSYLGPQPFAFDRTKMLAGQPATFVSPVGPLGGSVDGFLPADLDGATLPPAGAPNTFVGFRARRAVRITPLITSTSTSRPRVTLPLPPSRRRRRRLSRRSAPPPAPAFRRRELPRRTISTASAIA